MKDARTADDRRVRRLPKWKSAYLTGEFMWRWSEPFQNNLVTNSEDSDDDSRGVNGGMKNQPEDVVSKKSNVEHKESFANKYLLHKCPTCRKAVVCTNGIN